MAKPKNNIDIHVKLVDQFSKAFESATKGMLFNFAKLAGGTASLAGLAQIFRKAVAEALEAEKATRALAQAVRAQGGDVGRVVPELKSQAEALSRVALASDEAIMGVQKTLISLGNLRGQALEGATKATLDLAAGLGIDLEQAATMVAKAANGAVTPFSKLGLEFKKGATDAQKFDQVLKFVQDRFGGAAAAETETFSGAVHELNEAWSELLETMGSSASKATNAVDDMTRALRALNDEAEKPGGMGFWKSLGLIVAGGLTPGGGGLNTALTALEAHAAGVAAAAEKARKGGSPALAEKAAADREAADAAAKLAAKAEALAKAQEKAAEEAKKYAEIVKKLRADAGDIVNVQATGKSKVKDPLGIGPETDLRWADAYTEAADEALKLQAISLGLGDAWTELQRPVRSVEEAWERIARVQQILTDSGAEWTPVLEEMANALVEAAKEVESLGVMIQEMIADQATQAAADLGGLMVDAAFGAKVAWDEAIKSIIKGLIRATVQALILRAITGFAGGGGGAVAGAAAGGSGATFSSGGTYYSAKGGQVPEYAASGWFKPRGTDVRPAMLSPSEIVLDPATSRSIISGQAVLAARGAGGAPILATIKIGEATLGKVLIQNSGAVIDALDYIDARRG